MKILHIITGLDLGGAENSLLKLLRNMDDRSFKNEVVCLTNGGDLLQPIHDLGVDVQCLGYAKSLPNPYMLLDLARIIRFKRPDLLQTWMYHANLAGGVAARLTTTAPVIWNIRNGRLTPGVTSTTTRIVAHLAAGLSRIIPYKIVVNSYAARNYHESIGYDGERIIVIPNGFDVDVFSRILPVRAQVRLQMGFSEETMVIGTIGRYHPEKDLPTMLAAASILLRHHRYPPIKFVLCGADFKNDNIKIRNLINEYSLQHEVYLVGLRHDIPAILNALDVFSITSVHESFPNVLGEAMACEIPCVVTAVGDCEFIVGDAGIVVPMKSPAKLAEAWSRIIGLSEYERRVLGKKSRQRIIDRYEIGSIVRKYEELYRSVARSYN